MLKSKAYLIILSWFRHLFKVIRAEQRKSGLTTDKHLLYLPNNRAKINPGSKAWEMSPLRYHCGRHDGTYFGTALYKWVSYFDDHTYSAIPDLFIQVCHRANKLLW